MTSGAKLFQLARNGLGGTIAGRSAASNVSVEIAGLKELMVGLEKLPAELQKKAVYASLGAAARIVRNRAVELAPQLDPTNPMVVAGFRRPGTLKKAIRASRSKINKGQNGRYEMIVRVKPLKRGKGAKNPDDPYYWWWVEFGTSRSAAKPFLRPAFETTKDAQLSAMRKRMAAAIEREARAIAARMPRAA